MHDFYGRFMKPGASEKEQVFVGRIAIVVMMFVAGFIALQLSNALQAFQILLQIGAGTGLLFILRWFWWRINAISEVVAMVVSFLVAVAFEIFDPGWSAWQELVTGVGITTVAWVGATLVSKPSERETLRSFCRLINPGGHGWRPIYEELAAEEHPFETNRVNIPRGILCMVLGCLAVYAVLFATGSFVYGESVHGLILGGIAVLASLGIVRLKFNH